MNTERFYFLLTEYIEGRLDEDTELELRAELERRGEDVSGPDSLRSLSQRLGTWEMPEPSERMKDNFYTLLASEQKKSDSPGFSLSGLFRDFDISVWMPRLAYALVFLLLGYIGGQAFSPAAGYRSEIQTMAGEIRQVRQVMMLSLLDEPMAAERIKAINTSQYIDDPDEKIIDALLNALNNDPNENVRLAAVDALLMFSGDDKVRNGLMESIPQQQSPMMQIALADGMAAIDEKDAIPYFLQLLENEQLNESARNKINQTIHKLS